jgi:hypothetical protein
LWAFSDSQENSTIKVVWSGAKSRSLALLLVVVTTSETLLVSCEPTEQKSSKVKLRQASALMSKKRLPVKAGEDFLLKMAIATKEARETQYWL